MEQILYVSQGGDPLDKTAWSGTVNSIYLELKKYYKVDTLTLTHKASTADKLKNKFARVLKISSGKKRLPDHSIKLAKEFSETISSHINNMETKPAAIFVIGGSAIASFKSDIPVIYFSDALVSQMVGYYWFNIEERSLEEANICQKNTLDNASAVVLASEWAAKAAVKDYRIDPGKIHVVPLGANIDSDTPTQVKSHNGINILFVGVDWDRKGGDIAIECVKALNKHDTGEKYHLNIAGCNPPVNIDDENITVYGFLNRNHPEDAEKLDGLFAEADIFLLPTKAECAGIVFCEAMAHSLPSFTYDTGGTGDYVINGENGYRLEMGSSGEDFANKIMEILPDAQTLDSLKKKSRLMFEQKYNWGSLGESLKKIINTIMASSNTSE